MPSDDKPYEFAQHVTTQLLTVATAVPALMITFSKDFVAGVPTAAMLIAFASWALFGFSVLFGFLTLMALTGVLAARGAKDTGAGIMSPNVTFLGICQFVCFFLALSLVLLFGVVSACDPRPVTAPTAERGN